MKISIFTDASLTGDNGGYAFYIGCRTGKLQKAGKLKEHTTNIMYAEMYSIANALYTLKNSKFTPISVVWLYSDRKDVIDVLNGDKPIFKKTQSRKIYEEIKFLMMEICIREGKSIRYVDKMFNFNHITAHTGADDIKSKINAWCDENARRYAKMKPTKPKK